MDDGKSFEYEEGAFMHRRFVFSDNKLVSTNKGRTNLSKKKFYSECLVERIILLGLSANAKKAVIEPGNHEVDIELGPLSLRAGSSPVALTIRKPNVPVADDWTISIL